MVHVHVLQIQFQTSTQPISSLNLNSGEKLFNTNGMTKEITLM